MYAVHLSPPTVLLDRKSVKFCSGQLRTQRKGTGLVTSGLPGRVMGWGASEQGTSSPCACVLDFVIRERLDANSFY